MEKETLEEALYKYLKDSSHELYELRKQCFLDGYELAQERSCSEEDMVAFLDWSKSTNREKSEYELSCLLKGNHIDSQVLFNMWFEQFKKK
jgi:hypothetical protein